MILIYSRIDVCYEKKILHADMFKIVIRPTDSLSLLIIDARND